MKSFLRYIVFPTLFLSLYSCKKDNYSPPGTFLTGAIMYKGDSINVERNQVPYQLYQYGFGKVGQIGSNTTFEQNGSYSQVLYNGDYKLIIPNGQGPFIWKQDASGNPDSLAITLNGNQTVNLDVTPYYMIRNAQISASGGIVTATFKAEKIITDSVMAKDIERVSLYVNKTQFVSGGDNIAVQDMAGSDITDPNNITLSVTVPSITPSQNYIFARVGIKIANVEDMIFSPLQKIPL
ncbi:MAG: DUF3823 domain-containing protein [Bacteroidota bacterium]|nr:DUF3823 domain-containing protein [Bacteroidota bacterium]